MMDHAYEHGWKQYSFREIDFETKRIHGSSVPIEVKNLFNRGAGLPHVSVGVVPPSPEGVDAIGMHVHRDLPTASDVEEWYVIVDGEGMMTFSNGEETPIGPGDFIVVYPGTGHSLRATTSPVRLVSITPTMYTSAVRVTEYPEAFAPTIVVDEVNSTMNPLSATCALCGLRWVRPDDDHDSSGLAQWASAHDCRQETGSSSDRGPGAGSAGDPEGM